jgi:hypothetical protein
VPLDEAERTAEQVDAGGDDRRPQPGIVEREQLEQVVDVAAVVRRIDHAVPGRDGLARGCARCSSMRSSLRRIG